MARREMTRKSTELPCSQRYLTNSQVRPLFHRFLMDETHYASSSRMNTDERDITNGASIEIVCERWCGQATTLLRS